MDMKTIEDRLEFSVEDLIDLEAQLLEARLDTLAFIAGSITESTRAALEGVKGQRYAAKKQRRLLRGIVRDCKVVSNNNYAGGNDSSSSNLG